MTGKQTHAASWINADMHALAQTGEDDVAVFADMEQCSRSDWTGRKTRQSYPAIPASSA